MAFVTCKHNKQILALLEALGVNARAVKSFVIAGGVDSALTVHVTKFADVADPAKLDEAIAGLAAIADKPDVFEAAYLDVCDAEAVPAMVVDVGSERVPSREVFVSAKG